MAQKKKTHSQHRRPTSKSGGIFSSMRGGMKSLAGTGKKLPRKKGFTFWDVLFYILVVFLGAVALYRWLG